MKHLLEPFDILVSARAEAPRMAGVPASIDRAVASITAAGVRTPDPDSGLAHFIWHYLSSERGRAASAEAIDASDPSRRTALATGTAG